MNFFADLHIHSCLSPCASDDMTPANICGMAVVKGLEMIAVTDHNTARNLPYVQKCADAYGLLLIPGMEITTREEVHLLGYFPDVPTAVAFGEALRGHMPRGRNKPAYFGNIYKYCVLKSNRLLKRTSALFSYTYKESDGLDLRLAWK